MKSGDKKNEPSKSKLGRFSFSRAGWQNGYARLLQRAICGFESRPGLS